MPLIITSSTVHCILASPAHTTTFATALQHGLTTAFSSPHRTTTVAPNGTTTLFMPCTRAPTTSLKTVSLPPNSPSNATITLHDSTSGKLEAVLSGSEITAFRTALMSLLMVKARTERGVKVEKVVIMGSGKQAEWAMRLLSWATGRGLEELDVGIYTRSGPATVRERIKLPGYTALEEKDLEVAIRQADAIFCCTPSTASLFPLEWITDGDKRSRYVSLIGSYKPEMVEVEPALLRTDGWKVCVDRKDACFVESGEIIQSGIGKEDVEEVAELLQLEKNGNNGGTLESAWLGNVVFKCVGVAVMDLVVGEEIIRIAKEMGEGVVVEGFE